MFQDAWRELTHKTREKRRHLARLKNIVCQACSSLLLEKCFFIFPCLFFSAFGVTKKSAQGTSSSSTRTKPQAVGSDPAGMRLEAAAAQGGQGHVSMDEAEMAEETDEAALLEARLAYFGQNFEAAVQAAGLATVDELVLKLQEQTQTHRRLNETIRRHLHTLSKSNVKLAGQQKLLDRIVFRDTTHESAQRDRVTELEQSLCAARARIDALQPSVQALAVAMASSKTGQKKKKKNYRARCQTFEVLFSSSSPSSSSSSSSSFFYKNNKSIFRFCLFFFLVGGCRLVLFDKQVEPR
jgi:hypothetical protein